MGPPLIWNLHRISYLYLEGLEVFNRCRDISIVIPVRVYAFRCKQQLIIILISHFKGKLISDCNHVFNVHVYTHAAAWKPCQIYDHVVSHNVPIFKVSNLNADTRIYLQLTQMQGSKPSLQNGGSEVSLLNSYSIQHHEKYEQDQGKCLQHVQNRHQISHGQVRQHRASHG